MGRVIVFKRTITILKTNKNMRNARLLGQACFTLLLIVFLSTPLVKAQITVSLPDLQASIGETIAVPVDFANVESTDGFNAFWFNVVPSTPGIVFVGHDATGTLMDDSDWSVISQPNAGNLVGGFASSLYTKTESGTLIYILLRIDSFSGGDSIQLQDMRVDLTFGGTPPGFAPEIPTAEFPGGVSNEDEEVIPASFVLKGNYPNPFNPSTNIQFDLKEAASVEVSVMDMLGRELMSVPARNFAAGSNQSIAVNASSLTSGIYIYRVIANSATELRVATGTMTLLK